MRRSHRSFNSETGGRDALAPGRRDAGQAVDASVHTLPTPRLETAVDAPARRSKSKRLGAMEDAMVARSESRDPAVEGSIRQLTPV
jgi:hypothetical protein